MPTSGRRACAIRRCARAGASTLTRRHAQTVPASGRIGTTFRTSVAFQVLQETGAGMTRIWLFAPPVAKWPFPAQKDLLDVGFKPGNYTLGIEFDSADPDLDMRFAGVWTVQVFICAGQCGSKHPHAKILDARNSTFVITGK